MSTLQLNTTTTRKEEVASLATVLRDNDNDDEIEHIAAMCFYNEAPQPQSISTHTNSSQSNNADTFQSNTLRDC